MGVGDNSYINVAIIGLCLLELVGDGWDIFVPLSLGLE